MGSHVLVQCSASHVRSPLVAPMSLRVAAMLTAKSGLLRALETLPQLGQTLYIGMRGT
jgi:hypothetical protein